MNRLAKRLAPMLAVLLLAVPLLFGDARAAESTEDMVERAKRGVVQLYTIGYENGEIIGGCSGTGFAVGTAEEDSDVFVTNWHVVTCSGEFDPNQAKVYIVLENATFQDAVYETDRVIPCEVLYITEGNPDFAILRATEPVSGFKALPLLSSDEIRDGAHVVALGYPAVLDDFSATNGGVDDMSVTQGFIVRHAVGAEDVKMAGTKMLIFDALISHGNSGGALVNDGGAVVGINTWGFENFSAAVYIDYAMEALDGLGIHYDVYQPTQAGEQKDEGSFPTAIVLAGAGVVVLAVVVLVLVLRRKPAAGPDAPAVQAWAGPRQKKPDTGFTLLGPGGLSKPVPASGLVIGRDPAQCTLCLPAGAKGISRRHCQVTMAGGSLLLTDLGSSYGTFAAGQRLEPNRPVPLSRGSSFYLGDTTATFTVR